MATTQYRYELDSSLPIFEQHGSRLVTCEEVDRLFEAIRTEPYELIAMHVKRLDDEAEHNGDVASITSDELVALLEVAQDCGRLAEKFASLTTDIDRSAWHLWERQRELGDAG